MPFNEAVLEGLDLLGAVQLAAVQRAPECVVHGFKYSVFAPLKSLFFNTRFPCTYLAVGFFYRTEGQRYTCNAKMLAM